MNVKILISRTDRLGDVLLALPAVAYVRRALPKAEIDFLCRMEVGDVIRPTLDSLRVQTLFIPDGEKLKFVKKYDACLFLFWEERLSKGAFWSRVPVRMGIYSKPLSYLLLNSGIRQHRSLARKNEALYNLDLARKLLSRMGVEEEFSIEEKLTLESDEISRRKAEQLVAQLGLSKNNFIVVHPGMGGSALNPSTENYLQIIQKLKEEKEEVVLSLGPLALDQGMGSRIQAVLPDIKVIQGQSLPILREVFRLSKAVIAPSTGPLHLAHLAGTKTVGLFSPVLSHSQVRWGPWGGVGESLTLAPQVPCPAKQDCLGQACTYFPCMDKADWVNLMGKI